MPNVMAALPNIGGTLCSSNQIVFTFIVLNILRYTSRNWDELLLSTTVCRKGTEMVQVTSLS